MSSRKGVCNIKFKSKFYMEIQSRIRIKKQYFQYLLQTKLKQQA